MRALFVVSSALAWLALTACTTSGPPEGLPPPTALEERGKTLLDEGHANEAREVFFQALSQTKPPFIAAIGLSRAAIALGDWPLCERALRAAMSSSPGSAAGYDLLGRTLLEAARGRRGTPGGEMNARLAGRFFAQARAMEPRLPGLSYHAGLSMLLAGDPALAVPLLQIALAEQPQMPDTMNALVIALRTLDRPADVRALLEPLETQGTLDPELFEALVWAQTRTEAPSPSPPPTEQP